jgi:hypothetical protein
LPCRVSALPETCAPPGPGCRRASRSSCEALVVSQPCCRSSSCCHCCCRCHCCCCHCCCHCCCCLPQLLPLLQCNSTRRRQRAQTASLPAVLLRHQSCLVTPCCCQCTHRWSEEAPSRQSTKQQLVHQSASQQVCHSFRQQPASQSALSTPCSQARRRLDQRAVSCARAGSGRQLSHASSRPGTISVAVATAGSRSEYVALLCTAISIANVLTWRQCASRAPIC